MPSTTPANTAPTIPPTPGQTIPSPVPNTAAGGDPTDVAVTRLPEQPSQSRVVEATETPGPIPSNPSPDLDFTLNGLPRRPQPSPGEVIQPDFSAENPPNPTR